MSLLVWLPGGIRDEYVDGWAGVRGAHGRLAFTKERRAVEGGLVRLSACPTALGGHTMVRDRFALHSSEPKDSMMFVVMYFDAQGRGGPARAPLTAQGRRMWLRSRCRRIHST